MSQSPLIRMSRLDEMHSPETEYLNQAIEHLVREYSGYVHRLALSILDDQFEAEDVTQETFIAASRSLESFRGESSPRTWLTAITVNACRGRLRKRKAHQRLQTALQALHLVHSHLVSPEEILVVQSAQQALRQAVAALDEKHRLPILLRYVHELTVPEIAAALHTNPGTIYSRLYYARRTLMARLDISNPPAEATDE